jgi:hypothetical protein
MLGVLSPKKFGIRRVSRLTDHSEAQKWNRSCDPSKILHRWRKYKLLGVKKAKIEPQSPKTEFEEKISMIVWYIYRSGILHGSRKNIFGGQKGENKPLEPKNGIWSPKSVWSCDISIDREFYMEHEKIYFWGSKRQKKAFRAQNQYGLVSIDREFYME